MTGRTPNQGSYQPLLNAAVFHFPRFPGPAAPWWHDEGPHDAGGRSVGLVSIIRSPGQKLHGLVVGK